MKFRYDIDYQPFFLIASLSGGTKSSYHYVNSIETKDLDT